MFTIESAPLLGNKTAGDETLNTTTGAPDLSLFDLTLTTGLSENPDQTTLINHLCDIQVGNSNLDNFNFTS